MMPMFQHEVSIITAIFFYGSDSKSPSWNNSMCSFLCTSDYLLLLLGAMCWWHWTKWRKTENFLACLILLSSPLPFKYSGTLFSQDAMEAMDARCPRQLSLSVNRLSDCEFKMVRGNLLISKCSCFQFFSKHFLAWNLPLSISTVMDVGNSVESVWLDPASSNNSGNWLTCHPLPHGHRLALL